MIPRITCFTVASNLVFTPKINEYSTEVHSFLNGFNVGIVAVAEMEVWVLAVAGDMDGGRS